MNANIKVNEMNKTITISATFNKKATRYGSDEYKLLRTVKTENPNFTVKIQERKSKPSRKLTLDFMTRYMNDLPDSYDNNLNRVVFFESIKGFKKIGKSAPTCKFSEITHWFVDKYPNYADYSPFDAIVARKKATVAAEATEAADSPSSAA